MTGKKAIVLEKHADGIIVLFPDGKYKKINTSEYFEVGDYYKKPKKSAIRYAAAAVVILCLIAGILDFFTAKAYAQVVPGVELGINRWNRVVEVKVDDTNDMYGISDDILKGKSSEEATRILVEELLARSKSLEQEISFTVRVENNPALQEKLADEVKMVLVRAAKEERTGLAIKQKDTSFTVKSWIEGSDAKGNETKKEENSKNSVNKKVNPENQNGQIKNGSEEKGNKNNSSGKKEKDKSIPAYLNNKIGDKVPDDLDDLDDLNDLNDLNDMNDLNDLDDLDDMNDLNKIKNINNVNNKYNTHSMRDANDKIDDMDDADDTNGLTDNGSDKAGNSSSAGHDNKNTNSHGEKD